MAFVVVAFFVYRRSAVSLSPGLATAEQLTARARRAYAELTYKDISTLSVEELIDRFSTAHVDGDGLSSDDLRAVIRTTAEFLYSRYVNTDPLVYVAWRDAMGIPRHDLDHMLRNYGVSMDLERHFGDSSTVEWTFESLFSAMWPIGTTFADGGGCISKIVVDAAGVGIAGGRITSRSGLSDRPRIHGSLGMPAWYGQVGYTARSWWAAPTEVQTLLDESGELQCAEVGVIAEFGTGHRRPITLSYAKHPRTSAWILYAICLYHMGNDKPGSIEV